MILEKHGLRLTKENIADRAEMLSDETVQGLQRLARKNASGLLGAAHPITAEGIITFCRLNRRVCPNPDYWNAIFKLLSENAGGRPVDLPFILGAWHHTGDEQKQDRLAYHIRLAQELGVLEQVDAMVRSLSEQEWHHLGE
jgi:hypothetical protein